MYLYGSGFPKSVKNYLPLTLRKPPCRRPNTTCDLCMACIYRRRSTLAANAGKFCSRACRNKVHCTIGPKPWLTMRRREESSLERGRNVLQNSRQLLRCPVCTMSHGILADGAEGRIRDGASLGDGQDCSQMPFADEFTFTM